MIISLHTPKTGGNSFRNVLQFHFGDRLFLDYGDFPINKNLQCRTADAIEKGKEIELRKLEIRQRFQCIHGHFLARKYAAFMGNEHVKFVTWLRDPLERLASH